MHTSNNGGRRSGGDRIRRVIAPDEAVIGELVDNVERYVRKPAGTSDQGHREDYR